MSYCQLDDAVNQQTVTMNSSNVNSGERGNDCAYIVQEWMRLVDHGVLPTSSLRLWRQLPPPLGRAGRSWLGVSSSSTVPENGQLVLAVRHFDLAGVLALVRL